MHKIKCKQPNSHGTDGLIFALEVKSGREFSWPNTLNPNPTPTSVRQCERWARDSRASLTPR
jgi:hypothetical protein